MVINFLNELLLMQYSFTTEAFLAFGILLLILLGIKNGDKAVDVTSWIAIFLLFISLFIATRLNVNNDIQQQFFKMNYLIMAVKAIIIIAAIVSLILYVGHLNYNAQIARFEYPIIMLTAVLGMLIMVSANDFLTLYLGLELQSLAVYIMVAINRSNLKSSEAAIKYFVLGALSSVVLLYGISLIYGFSGTIFFSDLSNYFMAQDAKESENYIAIIFAIVFIITALCFKVSAVPFHMWTPDVYEGAPTPVTLFMASVVKVAALFLFLRVLIEPFGAFAADWQQIIMFVSGASLIVGALGAIKQLNIKRLLAYSSINHIGFIMLGMLVYNGAGVQAIMIYLLLYLVMVFGAFSFLMLLKQSHSSADMADKKPLEDITTYAGLYKIMPLTAIGMSIILLSMAGIPPFAGFFGKLYILKAVLAEGYYGISVIAALSAVVAMFYYLKIIKIMFFDENLESYNKKPTLPIAIIFFIAVIFNLVFFIQPNFIFNISYFSEKFFF